MIKVPEPVRLDDLFPDWSQEVDRRIQSSETRIKFWVIGGALANFVVAVGVAIPLVFYLGQISRDISASSRSAVEQTTRMNTNDRWVRERMVWEARVEAQLSARGIRIEHDGAAP